MPAQEKVLGISATNIDQEIDVWAVQMPRKAPGRKRSTLLVEQTKKWSGKGLLLVDKRCRTALSKRFVGVCRIAGLGGGAQWRAQVGYKTLSSIF